MRKRKRTRQEEWQQLHTTPYAREKRAPLASTIGQTGFLGALVRAAFCARVFLTSHGIIMPYCKLYIDS